MKISTFLIVLLLAAVVVGLLRDGRLFKKENDPVEAMKAVAEDFPSESHFNGNTFRFYDVKYNVTKSDSLVNPLIGTLDFSERELTLRCVFHWKDDGWVFEDIYNPKNGVDFLGGGGGLEIMSGANARRFFEKYGWHGAITEQEAHARDVASEREINGDSPSTPIPKPIVVVATPFPRRTPTPQQAAEAQAAARQREVLDIARKYASPK